MGLGYWDHLSFQDIAVKWAGEQSAFTSDEILQELISSMILGDFEDATGASRVELLMSETDESEDEAWQPFTRQDFLGAIACWARTNREIQDKVIVLSGIEFSPEVLNAKDRLFACGAAPGTKVLNRKKGQIWVPDPLPWEEGRAKVPWKELAEVPLERYPEEVRAGYLESFRIPFTAFAKWSKNRDHETPTFWYGSAKDSRAPATSDQEPPANRRKPAEQSHRRWIARAKELRAVNKSMGPSKIAQKIWREEYQREDANSKDKYTMTEPRDMQTIRRVLHTYKSEWDIPQES